VLPNSFVQTSLQATFRDYETQQGRLYSDAHVRMMRPNWWSSFPRHHQHHTAIAVYHHAE